MDRRLRLLLYVLLASLTCLVGCGERQIPVKAKAVEPSKTLAQASKIRSRAIGIWSTPVKMGSATIANGQNGYLHGPTFSMSRANEAFVGWRVHDTLDPVTGTFLNGNSTVLHTTSIGAVWQPHSPIPVAQQFTSSNPQFVFNENASFSSSTWTAAALWGDQGAIYVSELNNADVWMPPTRLGNGVKGWLVADISGGVTAIWIDEKPNDRFEWHVAKYISGMGWNIAAGSLTRNAKFQLAAMPRSDGLGNVMLTWMERQAQGLMNIYSTRYTLTGLFENSLLVRGPMLAAAETVQNLFLAVDAQRGDAELIYQVKSSAIANGLYAMHYSNGLGWLPARNVDGNQNTVDVTSSEMPGFATNALGEVVLAWVENQTDGAYNYSVVYANRYTPQAGWDLPQPVSPPAVTGATGGGQVGNINPTVVSNLYVETRDQTSVVVWVENSSNLSELFASSHTAARGFGMPELVTSMPAQQGFIEIPIAQMTSANFPVITWRQSSLTQQGRQFDVMISAQGGQTGTVVTPPVFDPSQPKPLNHILSTDNCMACHSTSGTVVTNHTEVIGTCESCHNGLLATGKSATHIPTASDCGLCHLTTAWLPAVSSAPPPVITPSANWSVPEGLWNDTVPGTSMFYIHGPELTTSFLGDVALGFVKHTQFNALTGSFERAEPHLYWWQNNQQVWIPKLPASIESISDSSMIQLKMVPATGMTYALWMNNSILYLASMQNGQVWSAPQALGSVDGYYQLVSMPNQSMAAVVWRDQVAGDIASMSARVILPDGSLTPPSTFQSPRTMNFSEPMVDASGTIHLAATQTMNLSGAGLPPNIITQYTRFNSASGWSGLEPGPIVPFATTAPAFTQLLLDQNNRVALVLTIVGAGGNYNGGIYVSRKQANSWSELRRIDRNANTQDFIAAKPSAVSGGNGQMMVVWVEGNNNTNATFDYHVYVSRWLTGRWNPPEAIGNTNDHFEGDASVAYTRGGDAYVAWVATMANNSVLYTKRFNSITGWDSMPEIVANTDLTTRGFIQTPAISYAPNNGLVLAWKESRRTDFNMENTLWVSRRLVP